MKKLGRAAYLLEVDGVPVVLKAQPAPPPLAWRRLLRRITGGSLPFQNELKVTPVIAAMELHALAIPKLVRITEKGEALYSLLPGSDSRDLSRVQKDRLLDGLREINLSARPPRFPWWKEGLFLLLDSPLALTMRRLRKAGIRPHPRWCAIMTLLSLARRIRFSRPVFLHNDLVMGNVLAAGTDGVGLIDFEDALYDRHFVLADAVDIAFDSRRLRLDLPWLRRYAGGMADAGLTRLREEPVLRDCIQACLLRHCAHRMVSTRLPARERDDVANFVTSILIDAETYYNWFTRQDD